MLTILWALSRTDDDSIASARTRVKLAQKELRMSQEIVQKFDRSNSPALHVLGNKLVAAATEQNIKAQIGLVMAERGEYLNAVATNLVQTFQDFNASQEAAAKLTLANIGDFILKPPSSRGGTEEHYDLYAQTNSAIAVLALESTQISRVLILNDHLEALHAREKLQTNGIRSSLQWMRRPDHNKISDRYFVIFVQDSDALIAKSLLNR